MFGQLHEQVLEGGKRGQLWREGHAARGREFDTERWGDYGKERECFKNASELWLVNDDLRYVEGLAMTDGIDLGIHHAWCVTADGEVVDPTWRLDDDSEPDTWEYLGTVLDREWYLEYLLHAAVYGVWEDTKFWTREGLPPEALDGRFHAETHAEFGYSDV